MLLAPFGPTHGDAYHRRDISEWGFRHIIAAFMGERGSVCPGPWSKA